MAMSEDEIVALNDAIAEATQYLIPTVPKSSENKENETRFSGAIWYDKIKEKQIICGGCGGIMSNFIFQLARLDPMSIIVYDPDKVELVNMAGQMFCTEDVNRYKVQAISTTVTDYCKYTAISAISRKYEEDSIVGNIMVSGFDNMKARKVFFNRWLKYIETIKDKSKCLYIDARLSFDTIQIFCITGDDDYHIKDYQDKYLFNDSQADETVCSLKQTTYMACMIASYMVNMFVNFCANEVTPMVTVLPYFTEYNSDLMQMKVK